MDLKRIEDIIDNSNDKKAIRHMEVAQKLLNTTQDPNKRRLAVGISLFVCLLGLIVFFSLFYFRHLIWALLVFLILCVLIPFSFWFLLFIQIPFDDWTDLVLDKKRHYLNNILIKHGIRLPKSEVREEMFDAMKDTMIIWMTFMDRKDFKDIKERDEVREELHRLLEEAEKEDSQEESLVEDIKNPDKNEEGGAK